MSKAVLISIRPEWCEKIVDGAKTIEVRKTRPKLEPPFKCYIYCTKAKSKSDRLFQSEPVGKVFKYHRQDGNVIGEFVCDGIEKYQADNYWYGTYDIDDDTVRETCLVNGALWEYAAGADLYGWHISDLVIYDEPKDLSNFRIPCKEYEKDDPQCGNCDYYHSMGEYPAECECDGAKHIKRPPQSWCYVEDLEK